jgi:hypothetical protein
MAATFRIEDRNPLSLPENYVIVTFVAVSPRPPMQLTVLDEFLRCRELPITELLAKFLESRGSASTNRVDALPGRRLFDLVTLSGLASKPGLVDLTCQVG